MTKNHEVGGMTGGPPLTREQRLEMFKDKGEMLDLLDDLEKQLEEERGKVKVLEKDYEQLIKEKKADWETIKKEREEIEKVKGLLEEALDMATEEREAHNHSTNKMLEMAKDLRKEREEKEDWKTQFDRQATGLIKCAVKLKEIRQEKKAKDEKIKELQTIIDERGEG